MNELVNSAKCSTDEASSGDRITGISTVVALARYTRAEVRTLFGPVVAFSTALTRAADKVWRTVTLLHIICYLTTAIRLSNVQLHVRQPTASASAAASSSAAAAAAASAIIALVLN